MTDGSSVYVGLFVFGNGAKVYMVNTSYLRNNYDVDDNCLLVFVESRAVENTHNDHNEKLIANNHTKVNKLIRVSFVYVVVERE